MKIVDLEKKFKKNIYANGESLRTIEWYEYAFKNFHAYVDPEKDVEEISEDDVTEYMAAIRSTSSPSTVRGRYVAICALLKYAVDIGVIEENPVKAVKKPKKQKVIIPSFSPDEVAKILNFWDRSTFIGLRNYTIMCVLLSTGLRKQELVGMTIDDVDTDMILVRGKGNKERFVPVGNSLRRALRDYARGRKKYLAARQSDSNKMWINKDGRELGLSAVNELFRNLRDAYKFGTRCSCHTFRHTFALSFLRNGGNVFSLQKILGHEDISTTQIYVDLTMNDIKNQGQKYNPLDNFGWKYV